ncbi:MAG: hypothetical protein QM756_29520 [Polyangiaceae bacterium]
MSKKRVSWLALAGFSLLAMGCAVGEGEGSVKSERVFIKDCWNGALDLRPDFFAANPYMESSLMIRVQSGDNIEEQSDGLHVAVSDLQTVRTRIAESPDHTATFEVGMSPGVSPPGVPIVANDNPPLVTLALYLNKSCHAQNASIYSISGSITFRSLFSGDPQESDAEERLTDASFDAQFADPRQLVANADMADAIESHLVGNFRFYFQRGQPAQPFQ